LKQVSSFRSFKRWIQINSLTSKKELDQTSNFSY
jgi:hypothetical protein